MNADAWAGWMSVKVMVESALRAGSSDPETIASALLSMTFDGHKGVRLRFSPEELELKQPLYVIDGDQVVRENPR